MKKTNSISDSRIQELQQILKQQLGRPVALSEAEKMGLSLIKLYEALLNHTPKPNHPSKVKE